MKLNIVRQGAPKVNAACIVRKSKDIVCISLDMHSKYCVLDGHFSGDHPGLLIGYDKNSMHLGKKKGSTDVEFLDFDASWSIFSIDSARYTFNITLLKNAKQK